MADVKRHVFVETNWVVGFASLAHHKIPSFKEQPFGAGCWPEDTRKRSLNVKRHDAMKLIDQLMEILQTRTDLPTYQRAVLKTAISFLEQETKSFYRDENWRVKLTGEELSALPGEYWEFLNGQPRPK